MSARRGRFGLAWIAGITALVAVAAACGIGVDPAPSGTSAPAPLASPIVAPARPTNYYAGPPDDSRSVRAPVTSIQLSQAGSSLVLRDIGPMSGPRSLEEHEVHYPPFPPQRAVADVDPVLERMLAPHPMTAPVTIENFLGQGDTLSHLTVTGDPPDTVGAVGPNNYVQAVNGGLAIWDKLGHLLWGSSSTSVLWSTLSNADGNSCATRNDGDPVVVYDGIADRWFITQFDVPNDGKNTAKSWQCVAVSKTSDPTGAYWTYDFFFNHQLNDYGKFGVWPDGYYATYNMFGKSAYVAGYFCAMDRSNMLLGNAATQQCVFKTTAYGALPASLEGQVQPPKGEPELFLMPGNGSTTTPADNNIYTYKYHVDWTTPANSALTGPTTIPVAPFAHACIAAADQITCIPEPSPGAQVQSLNSRMMFNLGYRNFGTHESIVANNSVATSGTAGSGVRWYELQSPSPPGSNTWTVHQSGTFGTTDGVFRWMASLAQDQAGDFGLGYSLSSASVMPKVMVTGRLASDALGSMAQGETTVTAGTGVETGGSRWGDYSNMTVDPTDDCTFWYTAEYYGTSTNRVEPFNWQSEVASFEFPNCGANDFTIAVAEPASGEALARSGSNAYAVTTSSSRGLAETITLGIQNLPSGVTAVFSPTTVAAGSGSTLTLSATAGATLGSAQLTVIGTATSACHPANAEVVVIAAAPAACATGHDGVWCWDTSLGSFGFGPLGMNSEGVASEAAMVGGQVSEFNFALGTNRYYVEGLATAATRAVPAEFANRNGVPNASGALFFGSTDGFVYRVDPTTGACVWRASIARTSGGANDYLVDVGCKNNAVPNPCSDSVQLDPSGTFTGDDHTSFIIVGTRDGATCAAPATKGNRVYAFRADDGTFAWKYDPEPTIKLGAITSLYPDAYADGCSTNRNQIIVGSLAPTGGGSGAIVTINAATGAQIAVDSTTGFATAVVSESGLAVNDASRCGHFYSAGTSSVYIGTANAIAGTCTTPPCELATFGSGSPSYSNVSVSHAHQGQIVVRQNSQILLLKDSGGNTPTLSLLCSYTPAAGNAVGDPGSQADHFYFATSQGAVIELPFDNGVVGTQTTNGGTCITSKIRQFSAVAATAVANPGFDFDSTFSQAYLFVGDAAGRIEGFTIPFGLAN